MKTNEFERLEEDLEAALAAPVPALHFAAPPTLPVSSRRPISRRLVVAGTAVGVALVGALIVIPLLPRGGATSVSAEELVNRSHSATSQLTTSGSYHLRASIGKSGGPAGMTMETWSFGAAGNRSESTYIRDGKTESQGQVATPDNYWMWSTLNGQTKIAHVAGATSRIDDFITPSATLETVLQGLVIKGCQEAVIQGEGKVAGRQATIVRIQPTPDSCKADPARPESAKVASVANELGTTILWIDKETNVQLKLQAVDPSGVAFTRYEVDLFESGGAVDESVLHYTPPAGTTVIETSDYSEAKSAVYSGK